MEPLARADLLSLEAYAVARAEFRARVIAHKQARSVALGPDLTLLFEDRLTVQYQVQEMLRIERIFEAAGIEDELAAYNPLIPDGGNLKATLLIEFPDSLERAQALVRLKGLERSLWLGVDGARIAGIADEDLVREDATKTSAVHFLRFELDALQITVLRAGGAVKFGVDHPAYCHQVLAPKAVRESLLADLA